MKRVKLFLNGVVLSGLMTATLRTQSPAVIKIDLDRKIAQIDPNIYGAFAEPVSLKPLASSGRVNAGLT